MATSLPIPPPEGFDAEAVLRDYPAPIAVTFAKLQESHTPLHRVYGVVDLFEVALKYCAIIMIQDYLRLGVRSPDVDEFIVLHFRQPSLGHWNYFLREIVRACRSERNRLFVPKLVDFYFDQRGKAQRRQHERIDQLINLRNHYLGHGARPPDEESEEAFQTYWPLLAGVLADLCFLTEYKLILHGEDGLAHHCMGAEKATPIDLPAAAREIPRGQLCLVHANGVLPLFPLLLYTHCGYQTQRGPCELDKIFFFNNAPRRKPEFLDYWMGHLKRTKELADRLRYITDESAKHVTIAVPQEAQAISWELMQESSRDLVGRVEEEQQILKFIGERSRGFLVVEGDPGIGKTALVSRTVRDLIEPQEAYTRSHSLGGLAAQLHDAGLRVAFHFCGADKSSLELPQILSSLVTQLPGNVGTSATGVSDLAAAARRAVSQTGNKLLLIVDGVDEALAARTDAERNTILNTLLFGGERLPANVFMLLGARRGSVPTLRDPDVPCLQLGLRGLPRTEIRHLLFRVVSKYVLEERSVDAIEAVSAGNPLYVRMLAEDLAQGRLHLDALDQLPLGVEGYFEKLLLRFASNPRWATLRDCLLLLAVARGFLSALQIAAITGLPQADIEAALDDDLGALLAEGETSGRVRIVQLFHEKFREFLVALFSNQFTEIAAQMNAARDTADAPIAPAHLQRIRARLLEYCRRWTELDDTYPLRYFSSHLYEAGLTDELEVLLTKTNFLDQKVRRLDDPFLAAEDVAYLVRVWLQKNRDADIAALAANESGFYRDGVASGLRVAASEMRLRVAAIVQQLLDYSKLTLIDRLRGSELSGLVINARRAAIEVAYQFALADKLTTAALDASRAVRALASPYLYRFWVKQREAGWELLQNLSHGMVLPIGIPNFRKLESCGGMSMAILIHHFEEPQVLDRLREPWRDNVHRVGRYRVLLRPLLFFFARALRHLMASQADFQPLNLAELVASYSRHSRQIPSRRLGLECLDEMENPQKGCDRTLQVLLDTTVRFDVYLMQVAERTLVLHGCHHPGRILEALFRIHQEGCPWFRQSALYTGFHILSHVSGAEGQWLEWYGRMVRGTVSESHGLFKTPNSTYPLLPHMGWAEIVFDKHRPSAQAQFMPQFYREAAAIKDVEYARRVLRAAGVLSHAYERHDLALRSLQEAAAAPDAQLRETLVEVLANIRFYDETAVNRFLALYATKDLATRVLSATPSVRSADVFSWIDTFMNAQMITSDEFRLQIVGAYRRAGNAKSLGQMLDQTIKWVMNRIAGREVLDTSSVA